MLHAFNRVIKLVSARNLTTMSAASKSTIGICQMRSTNDKINNREQVMELVSRSKGSGASFLFFPECCDYVSVLSILII